MWNCSLKRTIFRNTLTALRPSFNFGTVNCSSVYSCSSFSCWTSCTISSSVAGAQIAIELSTSINSSASVVDKASRKFWANWAKEWQFAVPDVDTVTYSNVYNTVGRSNRYNSPKISVKCGRLKRYVVISNVVKSSVFYKTV